MVMAKMAKISIVKVVILIYLFLNFPLERRKWRKPQ